MSSVSAAIRMNDRRVNGVSSGAGSTALSDAPSLNEHPAAVAYEIVTKRAVFDGLATEWNALFARAGQGSQAFQSFPWLWHWCNHYLDDEHSLAVVTGRRAGRLVLVWPLVRQHVAGAVSLAAMGAPVSQYSDALVEPSEHAARYLMEAWETVVAAVRPDLVWLPRVRADAAIAPLMHELGAVASQRMQAPYIDLSNTTDFDGYMQRRSSQARKRHRQGERRLASLDPRFSSWREGDQARALIDVTISMKREQLSERGQISPAFADSRLGRFFSDAADDRIHSAGIEVHALSLQGEMAGADIVVGCRDRVLGHVFTYDSRFAKDSVGTHVLNFAIQQSIAGGYKTFDLLAPADDYKLRYADGTVDVVNWVIPLTTKGSVVARVYMMMLRPFLKSLVERLPQRLRNILARRYYSRVRAS